MDAELPSPETSAKLLKNPHFRKMRGTSDERNFLEVPLRERFLCLIPNTKTKERWVRHLRVDMMRWEGLEICFLRQWGVLQMLPI